MRGRTDKNDKPLAKGDTVKFRLYKTNKAGMGVIKEMSKFVAEVETVAECVLHTPVDPDAKLCITILLKRLKRWEPEDRL
jgi:hypothetical protein